MLCERSCPDDAITIESEKRDDGPGPGAHQVHDRPGPLHVLRHLRRAVLLRRPAPHRRLRERRARARGDDARALRGEPAGRRPCATTPAELPRSPRRSAPRDEAGPRERVVFFYLYAAVALAGALGLVLARRSSCTPSMCALRDARRDRGALSCCSAASSSPRCSCSSTAARSRCSCSSRSCSRGAAPEADEQPPASRRAGSARRRLRWRSSRARRRSSWRTDWHVSPPHAARHRVDRDDPVLALRAAVRDRRSLADHRAHRRDRHRARGRRAGRRRRRRCAPGALAEDEGGAA